MQNNFFGEEHWEKQAPATVEEGIYGLIEDQTSDSIIALQS